MNCWHKHWGRAMSEPTKTFVPNLRFPEFREAPAWRADLLKNISPSIFDGTHQTPRYTENGIPFFSVENIISGNKNKFISLEDHKAATSKNKPEQGDILITRIGNIGFSTIINWDYEFSIYVTLALIKKSDKFIPYYLHSYFQSGRYQSEILKKSLLNAVPCKINMDELRTTEVLLPTEKIEQQKIADCLSSIDELITAQTKKIAALKDHKKGLMQQLFPAEGETVPKLRFPEFQDAGEWEEKALGDLSQIVRGGSPRPIDEYITSDIIGLNWLKIADVDKESKYVTFTKEKVLPTALSKTREVNPGDLIMSNSMSFGRPYILKIKSCIHDGWIAVTQINERASRDYLYYLILSPISQEYFINNAAGSGVQNLNADIIKLLPVLIPKLKEQQKIADCLSSIDELITTQIQKLEAFKTHKKAMMQQLFPNPVEAY